MAGPILLVFTLLHGRSFGADAAAGTLLGLAALTMFVVAYGRIAPWAPPPATVVAGWTAFLIGVALLTLIHPPPVGALILVGAGFALGIKLLAAPERPPAAQGVLPWWDLPARAGAALALVVGLTAASGALGPHLSGLLAPFPIITSVLAVFTHAHGGADQVRILLRNFLVGFYGFAAFCFTLAIALDSIGVAAAFSIALLAALVVQAVTLAARSQLKLVAVSSAFLLICAFAGGQGASPALGWASIVRAKTPGRHVPRPKIVRRLIPFPPKRKRQMAAYSERHYGERTWRLRRPRVIVEHWAESGSAAAVFNTFAPDIRDPELHELPNVCSHFVVSGSGRIYQLVSLRIRCRHTVGLNWTAIGIEHTGFSDAEVLDNRREMHASLQLTRYLRCHFRIKLRNVIGHNESLSSPFHRERVSSLRHQTHGDWRHSSMRTYRRRLLHLGRC